MATSAHRRRAGDAGPAREFDAAFFRRYYRDPGTRVTTPGEMRVRGELIAAILRFGEHPVRSILDAGCGIGLFRPVFAREFRGARYTGLEVSEYLCRRYGWTRGSVEDFRPRAPFDLVVCYDVLQYLDDRAAARAMVNLARLTRTALYFSALTIEDWHTNCDRARTDSAVNMRPDAWYRARLGRSFYPLGFGVWIRNGRATQRWSLEA